jgi:CRISPR-associated protein Csb3
MAHTPASIPVDLVNPGQVFACLGFLEAAEVILGDAEARFEWSESPARFVLGAAEAKNPFEVVLDFLATAKLIELTPIGYVEGGTSDSDDDSDDASESASPADEDGVGAESDVSDDEPHTVEGRQQTPGFPSGEGDRNSLPVLFVSGDGRRLSVSHWADGSSRETCKLYSGNRSARQIAEQLKKGLHDLWRAGRGGLLDSPFEKQLPLGGSFNFDARRAWTTIDVGFSPDQQKKNGMLSGVDGSPVVEILAAMGLEHARPDEYVPRKKVRYAVWNDALPPMLARAALAGAGPRIPLRYFTFNLSGTKHSKVTTFAREEARR